MPKICTKFSYLYNDLNDPYLNNKRIYTVFCSIDSNFDLSSTNADIWIYKPNFPVYFTENYNLEPILNYAISTNKGNLYAFKF